MTAFCNWAIPVAAWRLVGIAGCVFALTAAAQSTVSYTVRPGDNLIGIADALLVGGASPDVLAELTTLNRLRNPNRIMPGTVLQLPLSRIRIEGTAASVERSYGETNSSEGALGPDAQIKAGTTLRTGEQGGIVLRLPDGSKLWIREQSEVRVETLQRARDFDHEETVFQVLRGRVESIVNKLRGSSRYLIRTPVATTGVRGTEFRVNAAPDAGPSKIEVLEGAVGAGSPGKDVAAEVPVGAGFGTVATASAPPTAPVRLLDAPDTSGLPTLLERPLIRFQPRPLAGASGYRAEVIVPAKGDVVAANSFTGAELRFADLPDGEYALRFRGFDERALEGRDALHAFRLKARPEPPFPQAPPDRSKSSGRRIELAWTKASEANAYRLQVARDAEFKSIVVEDARIEANTRAVELDPGDYHWRVTSIRGADDLGPVGEPRRFTLRPLPKDPEPAKVGETGLSLSWSGEPGQTFEFELAKDKSFQTIVVAQRGMTEPTIDLPLPAPGRYYSRVRATDPDGFVAPYTTPQEITVDAKPLSIWFLLLPLLFVLF